MGSKKYGKTLNRITADIVAAPDLSDSNSELEHNQEDKAHTSSKTEFNHERD